MKKIIPAALFIFCCYLIACTKNDNPEVIPAEDSIPVKIPVDTAVTPKDTVQAYYFENLVFGSLKYGADNQYFSTTDSFFDGPKNRWALDSSRLAHVDILYMFDNNYTAPGFMDPHNAGQEWYWNDQYYYYPWLVNNNQTEFYNTNISKGDFDNVRKDSTLFEVFFTNGTTEIAPHAIFPAGTIIGGRQGSLKKGRVYGFKTLKDNKMGFIYIRTDQDYGWPEPITNFNTKVDIVKQR
jgi:hypothetical protein